MLIPATEVVAPEVEAEAPAEAEAVTITPEQAAAILGIDPADLPRVKNLDAWQKKLNKTSTEQGQARKADPAPQTSEGFDITDEQVKMFNALQARALGIDPALLALTVNDYQRKNAAELEDVTDEFFETHKDVTQDQVFSKMAELGVNVEGITPRRAKTLLTEARKSILADAPAPDYEAEVNKRLEAALAARLAEIAPKAGEQVIEVRPKKGAPAVGHKSAEDALSDPNLSFEEKMDIAATLKD
jgi:hypothetical protein